MAQIVPYRDAELERLYLYGRHLLNKLPRRQDGGVDIGEVDLTHLRVEKTGEYDVSLASDGPAVLKGFGDGAGGAREPEKSLLSELIEKFNERYGTNFTDEDLQRPYDEAMAEPKVRLAAVANDEEGFGHVFIPVFEDKMMDHFDTVADLGRQYFGPDPDFRSSLNRSARNAAWRMIREQEGVVDDDAA